MEADGPGMPMQETSEMRSLDDDDDLDQDQEWLTSTAGSRWSQRRFALRMERCNDLMLLNQVYFFPLFKIKS